METSSAVQVYLAGPQGSIANNSYDLMTNDMVVAMDYIASHVGSEFKIIEVFLPPSTQFPPPREEK